MRADIASALAVWVVLGLAACDSQDKPEPTPPTKSSATPTAKAEGGEGGGDAVAEPTPEPTTAAPRLDSDDGADAPAPAEPEIGGDPDAGPAPDGAGAPKLDPVPGPAVKLVTVEAKSPAVKRGKLVEHVGFGLPGGRMAPVMGIGCEAPCWSPAPMWPLGQTETSLEFTLYRNAHATTQGAKLLGKYTVNSIPPASSGKHTEVVLGLGTVDGAIVMHAKLRETDAALPIVAAP